MTVLAITVVVALIPTIAFAAGVQPASGSQPSSAPQATASVVRVDHYRAPRKKVIHRRLRVWAHPTPRQVQWIINSEARRWGISAAALSNRVACESHYRWWATNGQYEGVLQFGANAFYRGLSTIRTYKVRLVRTKSRRVHDAQITKYSDGRTVSKRTTPRRQRVIIIYTGHIPHHPSMANAWAQIRIGAQAIRGISAVHSSEWACAA